MKVFAESRVLCVIKRDWLYIYGYGRFLWFWIKGDGMLRYAAKEIDGFDTMSFREWLIDMHVSGEYLDFTLSESNKQTGGIAGGCFYL